MAWAFHRHYWKVLDWVSYKYRIFHMSEYMVSWCLSIRAMEEPSVLSYNTVKQQPEQFLACTSLTVEEFDILLPLFSSAWDDYVKINYVNSGGGSPKLPHSVDKLFFIDNDWCKRYGKRGNGSSHLIYFAIQLIEEYLWSANPQKWKNELNSEIDLVDWHT